jgi:hypothetical protein
LIVYGKNKCAKEEDLILVANPYVGSLRVMYASSDRRLVFLQIANDLEDDSHMISQFVFDGVNLRLHGKPELHAFPYGQ